MTIQEFIQKCESAFARSYTDGQRAAMLEKLSRFEDRQLHRIYADILETSKRLPLIADVYDSARSMGMLEIADRPIHSWTPTGCPRCRGEGRLAVIWLRAMDKEGVETLQITQMLPYVQSFDYTLKPDEYRSLFRCSCFAGAVPTLPSSWPRWDSSMQPIRRAQ